MADNKKVLLLSTNAQDTKILLWCLWEAGYDCLSVGSENEIQELSTFPLCKKIYYLPWMHTFTDVSSRLISDIKTIVRLEKISYVLPTGFSSVKFISKYKRELSEFVHTISTPTFDHIEKLGNKHNFCKLCETNNIAHPNTHLVESTENLRSGGIPIQYPLLTKPLALSGSKGIYKFENRATLSDYLCGKTEKDYYGLPLLLQEYIEGDDIDFNGFSINGKIIAWTIQKFIVTSIDQPFSGKWLQFCCDREVFDVCERIIKIHNYSGPIHIDLRKSKRDGKVYAIEVNPRFWGSMVASICDGINFADVAIKSIKDVPVSIHPNCSNKVWGSLREAILLMMNRKDLKFFYLLKNGASFKIKMSILSRVFKFVNVKVPQIILPEG